MKVKFKKLIETAKIPTMAHSSDAGLDLTATSMEVKSGTIVKYGTGLSMEMVTDKRCVAKLYPRSSVSKRNLTLANGTGIIDKDYRGELFVVFRYDDTSSLYGVGDRIAQLVIQELPNLEIEEVEELTDTERGVGGFGSTGK